MKITVIVLLLLLLHLLSGHGYAGASESAQTLKLLLKRFNKLGKPFGMNGSGKGFTGDGCSTSAECVAGRKCMDAGVCYPEKEEDLHCSCTKQCMEGETCIDVRQKEDRIARAGSCISTALFTNDPFAVEFICDKSAKLPSPTPSPPSSACVDACLLSDFASHELAFETHQTANVLCDAFGSCATGGHIVHYKGKAMMMKSYCHLVRCQKRVMEVNSPLRRRGLKINTKSKDLKFTAFAARYETRAEEIVLSTAVHIGL